MRPGHVCRGALALMLKRSSRVMPGLRGTPAGISTSAQPYSASGSWSGPVCALTWRSANTGLRWYPVPTLAAPAFLLGWGPYTLSSGRCSPQEGSACRVSCRCASWQRMQYKDRQVCRAACACSVAHRYAAVNVGQVRADALSAHNVVQRQLPNQRAALQQQRQRLPDPASRACDKPAAQCGPCAASWGVLCYSIQKWPASGLLKVHVKVESGEALTEDSHLGLAARRWRGGGMWSNALHVAE